MDEIHFDIHTRGKIYRDKNLIKNYYNKRAILESGISNTIFLSSNPDESCKRFQLLIQEKRAGNISVIIIEGIVALVDNFLEYKCMTPNQHKKNFKNLNSL